MNELNRWFMGLLVGLIAGSYTYTFMNGNWLETRITDNITRQLDIIERKIDQVIVRQWEEHNGRQR